MANKFPQLNKSEILKLANEVAASLKTIGAAELSRLAKNEGSSASGSISPEGSLGKATMPPEGSSPSASSASSGSPEGTTEECGAGSEDAGDTCGLPKGHKGDHEIHGMGGVVVGSWRNRSGGKKMKKDEVPGAPEGSSPSASSASSGSPEGSASVPPMGEGSSPSASSAGDEGGMPPPGAEGSAPPPGMEGSAPPPGAEGSAPPGQEGAAPGGPSFEELVSLYSALPPQDLEAHAAAMQQAMSMKQGAGGPPGGAPGMEGSAPPGGAPPMGAPPMGKQEVATHDPNIGLAPGGGTPGKVETANPNIGSTKKSEDSMGEKLAKAEQTIELLANVVDKLAAPARKAVTGFTVIPYQGPLGKSEGSKPTKKAFSDLTKAELHESLKKACGTTKLSKAQRDVVNEYYLNPGAVQIAALEEIYNQA